MSMVKSGNPDARTQAKRAIAERNKVLHYSEIENAWKYVNGFNTYDVTQGGWVNHLLRCKILEATSGFYDSVGNIAEIEERVFRCEVKPSNNAVTNICMRKKGRFVVDSFSCNFSFGDSDIITGTEKTRSHEAVAWDFVLCLRGYEVYRVNNFGYGGIVLNPDKDYSERTVYDVPYQLSVGGVTCDDIRIICRVNGGSGYDGYGFARTWVSNIKINGEDFTGNALITS